MEQQPIGLGRPLVTFEFEPCPEPGRQQDVVSNSFRVLLSDAIASALESVTTQHLLAMPFGGEVYLCTSSLGRSPSVHDIIILFSKNGAPRHVRFMDGRVGEYIASFCYALMDLPVPEAQDWEVDAAEHPALLEFLLLDRARLLGLLVHYAKCMATDYRRHAEFPLLLQPMSTSASPLGMP